MVIKTSPHHHHHHHHHHHQRTTEYHFGSLLPERVSLHLVSDPPTESNAQTEHELRTCKEGRKERINEKIDGWMKR